jgi:hypothetical protein
MVADALRINNMSRPDSRRSVSAPPEDRAAILFAELDIAQARGEFARAADAQRRLEELGWVITRRRPACGQQAAAPGGLAHA